MQPLVSAFVRRVFLRSGRLAGVALVTAAFVASESKADVISASSAGFNISAELSLTLLSSLEVEASVGPASYASVTSPPPFAADDSLASLSVSVGSIPLGTLLDVSTGLLTTSAASNVDGQGLIGTTSATATVDGLSLDVIDLLLAPSILSITAEAITSTAEISGGYGSLTGAGSTLFTGLSISLLGIDLISSFDGVVDANTGLDVASILGGVSILLNEQVETGNGTDSLAFTTNAIRVSFDNVGIAGIGTLNGDLIVSHATAEQSAAAPAVPEPASASLMGVGLVAAVFVARRRRAARG